MNILASGAQNISWLASESTAQETDSSTTSRAWNINLRSGNKAFSWVIDSFAPHLRYHGNHATRKYVNEGTGTPVLKCGTLSSRVVVVRTALSYKSESLKRAAFLRKRQRRPNKWWMMGLPAQLWANSASSGKSLVLQMFWITCLITHVTMTLLTFMRSLFSLGNTNNSVWKEIKVPRDFEIVIKLF